MQEVEYRLFHQIRTFSSIAVMVAITLSVLFSQFFGQSSMQWQVVIAVTALALGIPHGALDHLVTLPKSKPLVMALFIAIYVLVAAVAVVAILKFNVVGFIFVLLMSATHFGIGDAAFAFFCGKNNVQNDVSKRVSHVVILASSASRPMKRPVGTQ